MVCVSCSQATIKGKFNRKDGNKRMLQANNEYTYYVMKLNTQRGMLLWKNNQWWCDLKWPNMKWLIYYYFTFVLRVINSHSLISFSFSNIFFLSHFCLTLTLETPSNNSNYTSPYNKIIVTTELLLGEKNELTLSDQSECA